MIRVRATRTAGNLNLDGLTVSQTADRFGVSVDEVRTAQKQALQSNVLGIGGALWWEDLQIDALAGLRTIGSLFRRAPCHRRTFVPCAPRGIGDNIFQRP